MHFEQNKTYSQFENQVSSICGGVIKQIRKEYGITGAELARKLDISQQQVSRYERGVSKISLDRLFTLSIVLNVPFQEIIKNILLEMRKSNFDDELMLKAFSV